MRFDIRAVDGVARRGTLTLPRGVVETPAFMPVGTYGTVKGMLPRDIKEIGAEMILGNTFHQVDEILRSSVLACNRCLCRLNP